MYVMNTDNNERFGLDRVAALHVNPDGNKLQALVEYQALHSFRSGLRALFLGLCLIQLFDSFYRPQTKFGAR